VLPDDDLDGVDPEIVRLTASKFAKIGELWKSRVTPRAINMTRPFLFTPGGIVSRTRL
jgi:hypothetical protein